LRIEAAGGPGNGGPYLVGENFMEGIILGNELEQVLVGEERRYLVNMVLPDEGIEVIGEQE